MVHRFYRPLLFVSILIVGASQHVALAQEVENERVLKSDPQQLLELSQDGGKAVLVTSLADFENRNIREAPANITVITSRQIEASGARTLYEALQLIPGLSFGRDVDDVIGVGVHGNWAEEGKCLFLLNGRQLNENDFGTYAIGDRIPLNNVDRIEVIMGPGSIVHGGYAALGVVNIITRTADDGTGTRVNVQTGFSGDALTQTRTTVSGAHRLSRDQEVGYTTSHVRGQRSNALSLLPDSTMLNFRDSTSMQASTFQFNYRWKNLKATMAYMEENFAVSDAAYSVQLRDIIFGVEYKQKLSHKVELFVSLNHADQLPWYYVNTGAPERLASNTNNQRSSITGFVSYKPTKWLGGRIGVQGYTQRSTFYQRNADVGFNLNGERSITLNVGAMFAEMTLTGKPGLLSAGCRYENNSLVGDLLSPRVAYTKNFGIMHVKASWSRAFKTPTVMNLNYGPLDGNITTEHVTTLDGELGFKLGKTASVVANVFETRINNPIVYVFDEVTLDSYVNRNRTGTQGIDLRFSWETKRTTVLAGASLSRPITDIDLPELQLPDEYKTHVQGLPSMNALLNVAYELNSSLTMRCGAMRRGERYSYQFANADKDELSLSAWPAELVFNAGAIWRPKASNRLAIDMGCRNITDVKRNILSPFNNGTTPFTLNGREWTLGITYKFVQ